MSLDSLSDIIGFAGIDKKVLPVVHKAQDGVDAGTFFQFLCPGKRPVERVIFYLYRHDALWYGLGRSSVKAILFLNGQGK